MNDHLIVFLAVAFVTILIGLTAWLTSHDSDAENQRLLQRVMREVR